MLTTILGRLRRTRSAEPAERRSEPVVIPFPADERQRRKLDRPVPPDAFRREPTILSYDNVR
jgi:hypothetical protein